MEDEATCGKGLAEHSVVPGKMGELIEAVAANLETHMMALDSTDERSRKELDAYRALAKEHRALAAQLQSTARHMAGYRDLPMGRHDEKAMASPAVLTAFEMFVKREEELLALLRKRVEQDRAMLSGISR